MVTAMSDRTQHSASGNGFGHGTSWAEGDVTGMRISLMENGWVPLPVTSPDYRHNKVKKPGKQPFFKGWNNVSAETITPETIRGWEAIADHPNTSLVCGHLLGLDLDVPVQPLAAQIEALADALLGTTALVRIGKAPKSLRCYRHEEPLTKRETPELFLPDGTMCQVEAMGAGQQVVGFGIHPNTRRPYEWRAASPLDTPFQQLPIVTEAALNAFLAAAEAAIRLASGRTQKEIDAAAAEAAGEPTGAERPQQATGESRRRSRRSTCHSFYQQVNAAALENLRTWVPHVFPKAVFQPRTGAWRISSADLGRDCQEDLSIHPDGIRDFGPRKGMSPCDVVMEFGGVANIAEAAFMLCEWLGRQPSEFGWNDSNRGTKSGSANTSFDGGPGRKGPGPQTDEAGARPLIHVTGGKLHEAADAGLAALAAGGVPFYQRDRSLVRVCSISAKSADGALVRVPAVTQVSPPMLGRALGKTAVWEATTRKGDTFRINPPMLVIQQIGAMVGEWPFPPLHGVIGTPTLRPDGSLLMEEGYDPATGLFLFAPPSMPPVPDAPTKWDALEALATLNALLDEFPFANEASRSVAVSMLMTPVLRGAMAVAPMHVITKPEAGTGGSYLQDIASCIAVGDRCAVLSVADDPSETEKRLIGATLAQQPIIALDNVGELLMGDFLCQATERPLLQVRPLGTSNLVRIPNTFTTFANGNNLTIGADVVRRTVQCALDANMETPETREFSADPVAMVLADRGKYVAACLIIARAYILAGRPGRLPPRASYTGWSDTVRSALVWLNWPDPVDTVANIRVEDPVRQARAAVFSAWAKELHLGIGYHTAELIKLSDEYAWGQRTRPALWDALFAIAAPRSGHQTIDARLLGLWLRDNQGTIANGHKLTVDRSDASRPRWKLEPA
jgi:hypothetical protein